MDRASSRELSEWMAFDAVEGLPDRRLEVLLASLLALMVNVHRDPKARGKPATAQDFLPWLDLEDEREQPTDMLERVARLNALFGGVDARK